MFKIFLVYYLSIDPLSVWQQKYSLNVVQGGGVVQVIFTKLVLRNRLSYP